MKIVINPKYEHLRHFIEQLPQTFAESGTVIYRDRNEIRCIEIDGIKLCVKRFHKPFFFNRIIYTFFRKSKAQRSYDNAIKLLNADIPTTIPFGYVLETKNGLLTDSYFVTEYYIDFHMMYEFAEHPMEGYANVLTQFAQLTARMHDAGFYHKDYSPGNILWKIVDGQPQFTLIDINRMDFGNVGLQKGCKNFKRLWGEPRVLRFIAHEYARQRHFSETICEKEVLKAWRRFWQKRQPRFKLYD